MASGGPVLPPLLHYADLLFRICRSTSSGDAWLKSDGFCPIVAMCVRAYGFSALNAAIV